MRGLILVLLSLVFSFELYSIENKFSYLTPEDGLSQGNIRCVFQDSKGYIWLGTFNGLNRFDGYTIKTFNHDINDTLSLGHGHVKTIVEDKEHKLWLGTFGGGISVYYPETGIFRNITSVILDGRPATLMNITSLVIGPDENIWVLDERAGLFVFDYKLNLVKGFRADGLEVGGLGVSYYYTLVFDNNQNLWLGAGNGTLYLLKKNSDKFESVIFENRAAAADDAIKTMYNAKNGIIWIGTTSQGAYSFDPQTRFVKNLKAGNSEYDISSNTVMAFCEDWDDNLLIGTDGGGLNVLNRSNGTIKKIRYDIGNSATLSTDAVYCIYIDRSETLWIGTYAGGVNYQGRYRYKFKFYKPDPVSPGNSLSYKNAKCFLQDSDGEIWIGTDGGGLNKFDPATGTFTHFKSDLSRKDWLHTNVIIHLMQDSDGDIFIGSYANGLTIFDKKTNKFKQYLPDASNPNSIPGSHPWFCFQDSYGTIWVGMLGVGLCRFDKATESFTLYQSIIDDPTTLFSPNVKVIFEDKNQNLWVGTEGGGLHMYNRDKDNFIRFINDAQSEGSLSNSDVRAIFEDSKQRLWIGTGDGLNLMNKEKGNFEYITVNDGLPGNIINDILEDSEGNLWISTNRGISRFNPDAKKFRNYDMTDGLQGNEFNYTAAIHSNDGYFYFGGKNGFNVFKPEEIFDNPHKPVLSLTSISINNKPVDAIKVRINGRKQMRAIQHVDALRLSYKENIVTFEFSVLDFNNPVKNKYQYMLEGFDKEWTEANSAKRFATYTNLSGGKYVFRVKGANSDGVWNNEGFAIKLTIVPPFWKQTWFIILLVLLIGAAVYQYIRNKQLKNIEEKQILEEKIQAGMAEVEKHKLVVDKKDIELREKYESEKIQNWQNTGLSRISDVISKNKDNLINLSNSLLLELVDLVKVEQGALYLLNDEDQGDPYLEIMASFAPDDKRVIGARIETQEGNIGACYTTRNVIKIDNLPPDYASCTSGLGGQKMNYLVVVPLKLNEVAIGAVELLSFQPIEEYKVQFIEKAGETLTSILSALKANEKAKKLIENQKLLVEQSSAQEEELRQNLEELQATQEDLHRQMENNKKAQDELNQEKNLIDTLLKNAKEKIYFKDSQSKFIKVSQSLAEMFRVTNVNDLVGKSDFDFFTEEHARPAFEDEMMIIKTGQPIIDKIEKETLSDGRITYVSTTKMPLYDGKKNIVGTFGISKDVTHVMQMEEELKQRNFELLAQEEELRQNLEEMQTVQENLESQIAENKKIQEETLAANHKLEFENIMFSTLMDNIAARITYKNIDAQYIRVNKTKAEALGINDQSQVFGKTDLDIFGTTHSKERLIKEIEQIKAGNSSFHVEEFFKQKDGKMGWGDVNRIPLKSKEGEILGGLVITWDITDKKTMQSKIEQTNEVLKTFSSNLPVVFFDVDNSGNISNISGLGLSLLGNKNSPVTSKQLLNLFPDIKKAIDSKEDKHSYDFSGSIKVNNSNIKFKALLLNNIEHIGGYYGCILLA